MVHKPRVLVIAGEFWPYSTDASLRLIDWAHRLYDSGVAVTIACQRPVKHWPERVQLGPLPVVRFVKSSGWASGQSRYYRKLADWIQRHAAEFDYFYFDSASPALAAVFVRVAALSKPIVVRYDILRERQIGFETPKEEIWRPAKATLDFCRRADLIITPNVDSEQHLRAMGVVQTPVLRIADRSSMVIERSIGARREARKILANVNMDLAARNNERVLLCPGQFDEHWRIKSLIDAVVPVAVRYPSLRVWLQGEGPTRLRIGEELRAAGVGQAILMPGVFTDFSELFQAADMCIFPGTESGASFLIPTCLRNNIPLLVPKSKAMLNLCGDPHRSFYFDNNSQVGLREKLFAWLEDDTAAQQDALAMQTRFSCENELPANPREIFDYLETSQQ